MSAVGDVRSLGSTSSVLVAIFPSSEFLALGREEMGRKSVPIGSRYGRVCEELLETGARVAVRSYGHCPQTGRMYYKPPTRPRPPPPPTATGTGRMPRPEGARAAAVARRQQQQQAASKVKFHASEFILYGAGKEEPRHCSR